MEPELPTTRLNPERGPVPYENGVEHVPESVPERAAEQSAERYEQRSEAGARSADSTISLPTPVIPTPVAPPQNDATADDTNTDTPLVAADEDLIEKEWVDKAKQILARTKDDPHRREEEISRLQMEYLKKRYGKELGAAN